MSNDCYVHKFECEWSIIYLWMFLGMSKFWASTTLEPYVPKTQVFESMALHSCKALRLKEKIPR
jgi:hypothetical protein